MVNKVQQLNSPHLCYINLTNKCNLRCLHCLGDYSIKSGKELGLKDWKKLIDELIKVNVFYINLSGGEPTQSPYFKEILNYLSYKGLHFMITTNGVFSDAIKKVILDNREYLIGLKFSLDGYNHHSNSYLRRDKNLEKNPIIFKRNLSNIFFFKKYRIPLTIASVIHILGNILNQEFSCGNPFLILLISSISSGLKYFIQ
jgi:MoaA/NifB/PqqE/SkfB family radical SAM enzyme